MSDKEVIISIEEVHKFEDLYEKKTALNNLVLISKDNELIRNEELYQRFLKDFSQIEKNYQSYWTQISDKYDIHEEEGLYLNLDFKSCTVTLQPEE